eukprot:Skav202088  [mRNA]  locus=scaffold513:159461:159712:- [translate_table: standard]
MSTARGYASNAVESGDVHSDIDLQLRSLNGEELLLRVPRSTLGREVHEMASEKFQSKPGGHWPTPKGQLGNRKPLMSYTQLGA